VTNEAEAIELEVALRYRVAGVTAIADDLAMREVVKARALIPRSVIDRGEALSDPAGSGFQVVGEGRGR
jgi:hypothetical protein